jgi:DNA topoisomerase-2
MHLYSPEGHIKRYDNVEAIMRDYYDVRLELYQKRKDHQLDILEHQLNLISYKVKFILMVVEKKLDINNKKKADIEEKLKEHKFPKLGTHKHDKDTSYDYLLSMPLYNLTQEKIEELKAQEDDKKAKYDELKCKTPQSIWLSELTTLETKYTKWYAAKIKKDKESSNSIAKNKKKQLK